MSLAHAWNILMWSVGWIVVLYLVVCFIHLLTTHRYQRGWDRITREYPPPPVKPVDDSRSSIVQFRRMHKS